MKRLSGDGRHQEMRVFTACQISAARVATTIFARRDCQVFMEAIASKAVHFEAQSGVSFSLKIFFERVGSQRAARLRTASLSGTRAKSREAFRLRGAALSGRGRDCAAATG
jgi:hypothetical protein